jgi:putative tricarboxylic transport membrane protein
VIDLHALQSAFGILSSSNVAWLLVVPGVVLGMLGGALPGVSGALILALVLPLTLRMDFLPALVFLTAIHTGSLFGVAVPAILMNVPGSAAAVATSFDGYPMSRRGEHNIALGLALSASVLGHLGAYILLFLWIEPISHAVLKLGPPEMLLIMLWGLTLIAALRGKHMSRSLLAGAIGILIGTIGLSPGGAIRGTLGFPALLDGVPVISALIGLFAAGELFNLAGTKFLVDAAEHRRVRISEIIRGMLQALRYPFVILRGLAIGSTIGGLPGVGASVCNLISYVETRRTDKHPETYGTGNPKGVVAAEAGNASSEGGSMATLLALGIPGGASSAVMLAAFALHNINGGPQFISKSKDVVYAIIMTNFANGVVLLVLGILLTGLMANIVRIPVRILIPAILALATFGAYSFDGSMVGPITMAVFAVLGWFMRRHDYSIPACAVGLILGKNIEQALINCFQISGGTIGYFLGRPIALTLLVLLIGSIVYRPVMQRLRTWGKPAEKEPIGC